MDPNTVVRDKTTQKGTSLKHVTRLLIATAVSALAFAGSVQAQMITAIYGSGNPDNGWNSSNITFNIQLGLRAKNSVNGNVPLTPIGQYHFTAGDAWNFDFSINSDVNGMSDGTLVNLSSYRYELWVDNDPTAAQNWVSFKDPTLIPDNSYGNNATANGAGVEGLYSVLGSSNNIMQNSEKLTFFPWNNGSFSFNNTGIYDFKLMAFNLDPNYFPSPLAETQMRVWVDPVQTPVPEPSTYGLMGAVALLGLVGYRRMKGRNTSSQLVSPQQAV